MQALTDVRQISHIAYGFMLSKALFAALNIELFGHLAKGSATIGKLAERTGVAENRVATLLAALVSVGLVTLDAGLYSNSPAAQRYLVPGAPAYFGDYYRFQIDRQIYPNLMSLDAGLAGDEDNLAHQSMSGWLSSTEIADDFSRAQHAGSLGPAILMAKNIDLTGATRLLDVAGGTGAYSITFCQEYPSLAATIIDFPSVIVVAERFVSDAGLAKRIALVGGDALETDWPSQQDVVLMSYLLSAVGNADIPKLLSQAWAALRPRGRLIIHDFMLHDDRIGPAAAAAFFLSYIPLRTDPISFTSGELKPQIEALGFVNVQDKIMIPEITKALIAEKPGSG